MTVRVGAIDIGSDSTRLLVADVDGSGGLTKIVRRSRPTHLGVGLYASGRLTPAARARVLETLAGYADEIAQRSCVVRGAALTSAVRDAQNGPEFTADVRRRFRVDARVIDGHTEAELAFRGATLGRSFDGRVVVVDVGGGSTELVVADAERVLYPGPTHAGAVRKSTRFLHGDPPRREEVAALRENVRRTLADAVPTPMREGVSHGLISAESWTWRPALAALGDEGVAAERSGILSRGLVEHALERLLTLRTDELRQASGVHPERASTLVAGAVLMLETMEAFGLESIELADGDLLEGLALRLGLQGRVAA